MLKPRKAVRRALKRSSDALAATLTLRMSGPQGAATDRRTLRLRR